MTLYHYYAQVYLEGALIASVDGLMPCERAIENKADYLEVTNSIKERASTTKEAESWGDGFSVVIVSLSRLN